MLGPFEARFLCIRIVSILGAMLFSLENISSFEFLSLKQSFFGVKLFHLGQSSSLWNHIFPFGATCLYWAKLLLTMNVNIFNVCNIHWLFVSWQWVCHWCQWFVSWRVSCFARPGLAVHPRPDPPAGSRCHYTQIGWADVCSAHSVSSKIQPIILLPLGFTTRLKLFCL